jgi:hypothetical protein
MKMTTEFHYSQEYDYERILYTFAGLKRQIYVENGFYPVDIPFLEVRTTVVFPLITQEQYLELSDLIEDDAYNVPILIHSSKTKRALSVIKNILHDQRSYPIEETLFNTIRQEWQKLEREFIQIFETVFKPEVEEIKVKIYISNYGTRSSFNFLLQDNILHLSVSLRADMKTEQMVPAIVAAYIAYAVAKNKISWIDRMVVIENIIRLTPFRLLLEKEYEMLKFLKEKSITTEVLQNSLRFLSELNYKTVSDFEIKDNKILIKGNKPEVAFTKEETLILNFIYSKNKLCTYFELADILWTNTDEYSVWAISKLISRIRKKLILNGLDGKKLRTLRGKGFVLNL